MRKKLRLIGSMKSDGKSLSSPWATRAGSRDEEEEEVRWTPPQPNAIKLANPEATAPDKVTCEGAGELQASPRPAPWTIQGGFSLSAITARSNINKSTMAGAMGGRKLVVLHWHHRHPSLPSRQLRCELWTVATRTGTVGRCISLTSASGNYLGA